VFSPYYAWARRRGPADPFNYCALNVALYGAPKRWAMTERGRRDIAVSPDCFEIGPSDMAWRGDHLEIRIDERSTPDFRRLRGLVRVHPQAMIEHQVVLDANDRHIWQPYAPRARVEVMLSEPELRWSGPGYFDSNRGSEPLERGFSDWTWSRTVQGDDTLVLYDATRVDGSAFNMARSFAADGSAHDVPAPPAAHLKRGLWHVARPTRADAGTQPSLVRALEDAPFYTRSEIRSTLLGRNSHGVHESLDLRRFSNPIVQMMLPFRMPRMVCK
jgi:carotenoid 1,2-hydratase